MDEKLDFSLPEKKQKTPLAPKIAVVLLLVLIGLTLANLLTKPSYQNPLSDKTGTSLSPEQVKELAAKLAESQFIRQSSQSLAGLFISCQGAGQ